MGLAGTLRTGVSLLRLGELSQGHTQEGVPQAQAGVVTVPRYGQPLYRYTTLLKQAHISAHRVAGKLKAPAICFIPIPNA